MLDKKNIDKLLDFTYSVKKYVKPESQEEFDKAVEKMMRELTSQPSDKKWWWQE